MIERLNDRVDELIANGELPAACAFSAGARALPDGGRRRRRALPAGRPAALRVEARQRRLKVGRQRRLHLDALAGERMREGEPPGVQELAPELLVRDAVDRVADDRQLDRRQVDADLVRPAGLEADASERVPGSSSLDLEVRDRLARRVGVERMARRVAAVAADRRLDPPAPRARPAADEGEVARARARAAGPAPAAGRAPPPSARRRAGPTCRGRAGGRCPAARRPRRRRSAPSEAVDERAGRVARRRDGRRRPPACRRRAGARPPRRSAAGRLLASSSVGARSGGSNSSSSPPVSRWLFGRRVAVHERRACLEQPLGRRARADLRQRGEEAVEPLARGLVRDDDRCSPVSVARVVAEKSATSRIATPTTMKLSARLNAGQ